MTNQVEQDLLRILERHVSSLNAKVMLERARRAVGAQASLQGTDRARAVQAVMVSARLFVEPATLTRLQAELTATPASSSVNRQSLLIVAEHDILRARLAARELSASLGARALVQQRVATVVSELTRNMVAYAGGGKLELTPDPGPPATLHILAEDKGPGIPNLEDILAGRYRSRTGLGKGLIAVKQLMETFTVSTGPTGTRIEVETRL